MHNSSTTTLALSNDQLHCDAPSIFATHAAGNMSAKYVHIPTIDVVEMFRKEGFFPVRAFQSLSRTTDRNEFMQHVVRFRQATDLDAYNSEVGEIVLVNAHNGAAAYQIMSGLFRTLCSNGIISRASDLGTVSVRHLGGQAFKDKILDATYRVVSELPKVVESVERFKAIGTTVPVQRAYAESAVVMADKANVTPECLLTVRRHEDAERNVWNTFNTVQENLVKGGLDVRTDLGKKAKTRPIKAVQTDLRINKGLWMLTEKLAAILS
jgi:hypothetical protein